MRSSNPALSEKVFLDAGSGRFGVVDDGSTMSVNGTINKTGLMLVILSITGLFAWNQVAADPLGGGAWLWGGAIGGLIVAIATVMKPAWSPITAPLYAALEGLFVGAVSARYAMFYEGIVMQAVMLTVGTAFAMLMAYRSGLIRATEKFRMGVVAATGGIFLIYLATMGLRFFGMDIPYIHGSGMIGIGFSLLVVGVAALNLILDFDFIEQGSEKGAPKFMEWYGAFGLTVTLVWLYIEFLRLLSKLRD